MGIDRKHLLVLGSIGFPFGSADSYRVLQLSKILQKLDYTPIVVNRFGKYSKKIVSSENIKVFGCYEGVNYVHTSLVAHRSNIFLLRFFLKIIGLIIEFICILYFKLFKNMSTVIVYTTFFKKLKYYYFISRILKLKLIYDYVEYVDALSNRNESNINKLPQNFDVKFHGYIDKCIVISPFLENHLKVLNTEIPSVLLPPAIDFEKINKVNEVPVDFPFFLYCGAAYYIESIKFIINAYHSSRAITNNYKLIIVTYGRIEDIKRIQNYIKSKNLNEYIILKSELAYEKLIGYYKSASALLIPLTNNVQDIARFPFKICEYTASKSVVITTGSGVINHYFKDKKNALIAMPENEKSFSDKLNYCMIEKNKIKEYAMQAYDLGEKYFNYKATNEKLEIFFKKTC